MEGMSYIQWSCLDPKCLSAWGFSDIMWALESIAKNSQYTTYTDEVNQFYKMWTT